jgi:exodeoxyribonuclease VII small subunit
MMAQSSDKHFFEKGLERLEEIATLLDEEGASLEESLRLYEEGKRLQESLSKYLAEAERRITVMDTQADASASTRSVHPQGHEVHTVSAQSEDAGDDKAEEGTRKRGRPRRSEKNADNASGEELLF